MPTHSTHSTHAMPTHSTHSTHTMPTHSTHSTHAMPTHSTHSTHAMPTHSTHSTHAMPTHSTHSTHAMPTAAPPPPPRRPGPSGAQAPNEQALCYKDQYEGWATQHGVQVRWLARLLGGAGPPPPPTACPRRPPTPRHACLCPLAQVITSTRDTFSEMFDDDQVGGGWMWVWWYVGAGRGGFPCGGLRRTACVCVCGGMLVCVCRSPRVPSPRVVGTCSWFYWGAGGAVLVWQRGAAHRRAEGAHRLAAPTRACTCWLTPRPLASLLSSHRRSCMTLTPPPQSSSAAPTRRRSRRPPRCGGRVGSREHPSRARRAGCGRGACRRDAFHGRRDANLHLPPAACPPAAQVCREAEITVVVKQSEEAEATEYLQWGKPRE